MGVSDKKQLAALRDLFVKRCFDIVERGVEDGDFEMKDVAECLGISSQVASKIVNSTNPRILTAFELFRMSILVRRPVMEIIPADFYLTAEELKDAGICSALNGTTEQTSETWFLIESYRQLPESCRQSIFMLVRTMREMVGKT